MKTQTSAVQSIVSKTYIENIFEAFRRGIAGFTEAGKMVMDAVDNDSEAYSKIHKAHPELSFEVLEVLEKIGRGVIEPSLLFDTSPGARALIGCPIGDQRKYTKEPVLVISIEDGKQVQRMKPLPDLTQKEVRRAFNGPKIRTPDEQIDFIARDEKPHVISAPAVRYQILCNCNVLVLEKTEFTLVQLEEVLELAKAKALKSLATKK
jgi:hypothetical protein